MDRIAASVGTGSANLADDVALVRRLLRRHARWVQPLSPPPEQGPFDAELDRAIRAFQANGAALAKPDGVISPSGYTFKALDKAVIGGPRHRVFTPFCWAHIDDGLTAQDYDAAAKTLGADAAAIRAVADTETKSSSWDNVGRPTILFERHYFSRLTQGAFDRSHTDISAKSAGGYGKFAAQYPKLIRAAMLDEDAALRSASWGKFQIMGDNFKACGFTNVASFVDAMLEGERRHLAAFVSFIGADGRLKTALQKREWATFARIYNGPKYADNAYDTKMADAYAALTKR